MFLHNYNQKCFFFQQRPLDNRRRTTSEDTPRSQCDNISNFFLRWAIVKCPFCLTRSGTTSIEASDKLLKVFVIELAIQLWITRNMRISSYALRVSAYICAYILQIRINHMLNMRDMRMCAYRFQIRISYWCLCIKWGWWWTNKCGPKWHSAFRAKYYTSTICTIWAKKHIDNLYDFGKKNT